VPLQFELYQEQLRHWPNEGRHILAQYDAEAIIVYQAFRPEIARYAVAHGAFGGEGFSYSRMSWIKPNFLWMMYRAGWATKGNQEAILALRISRMFFDSLLADAVASSFGASDFGSQEEWQRALAKLNVRLQWDPDHGPKGAPQQRRAIQLGLRGEALAQFGQRKLLEVMDITSIVVEQKHQLDADEARLQIPRERVHWPGSEAAAKNVGLTARPAQ
jgi:hypothetical protein